MKIIRFISRVFVGIIFIYSGFVKVIDPLGSMYKFTDYFKDAFGMDWMIPLSLPLAYLMSSAELVIGIALLMSIRMRISAWAVLLFMSFFTPLTLYLAIANPVHDCGCFGDALILTNWQTFWKNIIILIPVLIIFIYRKKYENKFCVFCEWLLIVFFFLISFGISLYCHNHLPLIDFRPYKTGSYIPGKMIIPEGAPQPVYENTIVYKKNGVEKEFTLNNLPDSTWQWVETRSIEIQKGYEPPIHDFSIESEKDGDITDIVLEDDRFTFLLIAYDLEKTNTDHQKKINQLANFCLNNNHQFLCLTAATSDQVFRFKKKHKTPYDFCFTDEITLKTMVRANPGLMLLKKGTVLAIWHFRDIPEAEKFGESLLGFIIDQYREKNNNLIIAGFIFLLIIFILFLYNLKFNKENHEEKDCCR